MIDILLFIILPVMGYITIGTFWGKLLYHKYGNIYDEVGSMSCGISWPLSIPIIISIWLAFKLYGLTQRNSGWYSR